MKVRIKSFKSVTNQQVELDSPSIILLKGRSGVGKSTLLNAIAWCLYDKGKQIAPWGHEKATTYVSVTVGSLSLSVFRQRSPKVFTVTYGSSSYANEAAQSVINQLLGDYSVWMTACYIPQNGKSHILSVIATERLSILESLSFQGESPELYMQKVNELIISTSAEYKAASDSHSYLQSTIKMMASDLPSLEYTPSATLEAERRDLQTTTAMTREELNSVNIIQGRLLGMDSLLSTIKTKLAQFPVSQVAIDPTEVSRLERQEAIANTLPLYRRLTNSLKEIPQFNSQEIDITVTDTVLANAEYHVNNYNSYLSNLQVMGLDPDPGQWKLEMQGLSDKLSLNKRLGDRDKLIRLKLDADAVRQVGVVDDRKFMELVLKHRDLMERSKILVCPNCKTGLCFTNNGLMCADKSPVGHSEITEMERQLAKAKLDNENHKRYEGMMSIISSMPQDLLTLEGKILSKQEEGVILDKLFRLDRLVPQQKPTHDIQRMKRTLEANRNKAKMEDVTAQLRTLPFSESEYESVALVGSVVISQKLKDARSAMALDTDRKRLLKEKETMEVDRMSLQLQTTKLGDLKAQIQQAEARLHDLARLSQYAVKLEQLQPMITELERLEAIASKAGEMLNNLSIIRDSISLCRYKVLCNTVLSINRNLTEICKELFEEGLSISLQLCADGQVNIRNAISISVMYKGHECGSLADLSGGEFDRACLAISISILRSTNLPFVMLDESFGSLDHRTREQCLSMLKKHLNDRLVLCVDHGGTEGYYDRVISFS